MDGKEELYDLSQLIAVSRGNDAFVKKMVDIFCSETAGMLNKMTQAYYAGNLEKMGDMAHRIKPSIDNLKISALKQTIRDVEKMGSGEMVVAGLEEALDKMARIINDVISSLRSKYPA